MRPLIGVFTSERHASTLGTLQRREGAPAAELRLGTPYLRAIEAAGGLPVVLATGDPALVERLDGLCLAGGPDIDPRSYGDTRRHELLGDADPAVDTDELALARAADARALPLLGICRGAQALNVARGGTLHQHVEGHRQDSPAEEPAHPVAIAPGSLLATICGEALDVNSFHHQAADRLGAGVRAVATAPDGAIEAIEDPTRPFWLGVQWHAEAMEHNELFGAFVAAASAPRLALAA